MPLSTAAREAALDGMTIDLLSLHSAYTADGTGSELTGGSPAYAREAATFDAASSGARALNADVTFDVPAASSVAFVGLWNATGPVWMGCIPNGASAPAVLVVDDAATDVVKCKGHGFSDTNTVVVFGADLPSGLTAGTVYYVRDSATNTFKLALTSGGAAIDLGAGTGTVQKITVETFAGQGQFTVQAASTSLDGSVI